MNINYRILNIGLLVIALVCFTTSFTIIKNVVEITNKDLRKNRINKKEINIEIYNLSLGKITATKNIIATKNKRLREYDLKTFSNNKINYKNQNQTKIIKKNINKIKI